MLCFSILSVNAGGDGYPVRQREIRPILQLSPESKIEDRGSNVEDRGLQSSIFDPRSSIFHLPISGLPAWAIIGQLSPCAWL
jgi:hypothetical protein